jgi:Fe-Mn family superoxide dismutase
VEFVPLKHSYSEYEPLVDADTMRIHHGGHFKAYTDNLNAALLQALRYAPDIASMSLVLVLQSIQSRDETLGLHMLPANISTAIMNNGGGYINHVLFFNQLRERP